MSVNHTRPFPELLPALIWTTGASASLTALLILAFNFTRGGWIAVLYGFIGPLAVTLLLVGRNIFHKLFLHGDVEESGEMFAVGCAATYLIALYGASLSLGFPVPLINTLFDIGIVVGVVLFFITLFSGNFEDKH